MKKIILLLLVSNLSIYTFAQDEKEAPKGPWTKGLISTATFTQTSLTNWAAGGQNALSLNLYGKFFANYKKGKNSWENSLEVAYGLLRQEQSGTRKSDDKIDFLTKYNRQLKNEKWFFSTFANFKSQFARGFSFDGDGNKLNTISQFAAPAYLFITAGLEYKPVDYFSIYLSPITSKNTIVAENDNIDETNYGLDSGDVWRFEAGAYARLYFKKELLKNINAESKAEFFTNYVENFGDIDVNWETAIVMKINKYMSTNLFTHLIYDKDINTFNDSGQAKGPKVQFKQVFGLGFTYTL